MKYEPGSIRRRCLLKAYLRAQLEEVPEAASEGEGGREVGVRVSEAHDVHRLGRPCQRRGARQHDRAVGGGALGRWWAR